MDDTPVDIATVTVSELEYVRGVLSFTVDAADGTELLHVEREEAGTLVTPPVRAELAGHPRRPGGRARPGARHGTGPRSPCWPRWTTWPATAGRRGPAPGPGQHR